MAAGCEICCYFFKNLNQFRHFSAILFLFFLLECVEESLTRLTDKQLIYNRLCSISKSIIHQSHYILTLFTILQTPPSIIPSKCFLDDVSILGFITVYSVDSFQKQVRSFKRSSELYCFRKVVFCYHTADDQYGKNRNFKGSVSVNI